MSSSATAAAASDARRKAEIEAKKAKLLEIRRQRDERAQRLKAGGEGSASNSASVSGSVTPALPPSSRKDLDDLVNSLISGNGVSAARAVADDSPRTSVASRAGGPPPDPPSSDFGESESDAIPPTPLTPAVESVAGRTAPLQLIDTHRELFELPQKQRVYYTKQVQTTETDSFPDDVAQHTSTGGGVGAEARVRQTEETLRAQILAEQAEELSARNEEDRLEREIQAQLRELTEEERLAVYAAHDFGDFVAQSSKIVERAMAEKYDYMVDYRLLSSDTDDAASRTSQLRLVRTFSASGPDAKLFENRSITALDWSWRYPELCVAAYNRNAQDEDSPDGLVAVWNMHLRERPEFVFYAQTDVVSVCFSPFHPNLVIGGTYSGQILIWDTRARHLPVLKTPLSATGHTHPVYGLKMIGSANANNLVSASSDGNLCWWMLDMLARPQETLELTSPLHPKTDEVAVTTLGVADQESISLLVGTEEGTVYAANRFDRAGLKAGLNLHEIYRGHLAPVTGIDFHPLSQSYVQSQDTSVSSQQQTAPSQRHAGVDFSDLFLTSSMDWTCKLWRLKSTSPSANASSTSAKSRAASTSTSGETSTAHQTAILTFEESNDHIYDVKWSSSHPAVFGQVDGTGRFDVFNLNVDTERPIASAFPAIAATSASASAAAATATSATLGAGDTAADTQGARGLNRLSWSKTGRNVAMGGSDGRVYVYEVPEPLATPTEQDFAQFQKTVTQLLTK